MYSQIIQLTENRFFSPLLMSCRKTLFAKWGKKNKKLINIYKQKALNKAHAKID